MTWVVANPLRDPGVFCGNVGCGLCYDWADEASDEVTEGIRYIASQLMQILVSEVTAEMIAQVREGLLRAHASIVNIERSVLPGPEDYDEAQQVKRIKLQTKGVLRSIAGDKLAAKSKKRRNTVVIDQISEKDLAKAVKPKTEKKQKVGLGVFMDEIGSIDIFKDIQKEAMAMSKKMMDAQMLQELYGKASQPPTRMTRIEFDELCRRYAYSDQSWKFLQRAGRERYDINTDEIVFRPGELEDLLRQVKSRKYMENLQDPSNVERYMMRTAQEESARERNVAKQLYNEEKERSRVGWLDPFKLAKVPTK
jgi:hypothetical protein